MKYEQSVKALREVLGDKTLREVKVDDIRALREAWKISPITMQKHLEMVKAFFKFCVASGWLDSSPAESVKGPTAKQKPTLPFTDDEIDAIFEALDRKYLETHPFSNESPKRKIRAFILVMLYSGVRISDAVFLKRERIKEGKLFLYTHKTNVPVWVPLPDEALKALADCGNGEFYFSTGRGKVKTWTTEREERLKKVFVIAGLPGAHSHMLRDTFAASLSTSPSTVRAWGLAGLLRAHSYGDRRNQYLYEAPGMNPPVPHHGRKLSLRLTLTAVLSQTTQEVQCEA